MGVECSAFKGTELRGRFALPQHVTAERLAGRDALRRQLDGFGRGVQNHRNLRRMDRFSRQACELVLSGKVQVAFNTDEDSSQTKAAYGNHSIGQKAVLARQLVEAGVTFVLVSGAWGYFDHHGNSVRWGGIEKGLTPLLPRVDRTLYALVTDLEDRGLLDTTLILMMGEFGRAPMINRDSGRDHWLNVMSMVVAGGGLTHGQVIGSTDRHGGSITTAAVRPQDLAATTFRHLGIDLNLHWTSPRGRPIPILAGDGRPIPELG